MDGVDKKSTLFMCGSFVRDKNTLSESMKLYWKAIYIKKVMVAELSWLTIVLAQLINHLWAWPKGLSNRG